MNIDNYFKNYHLFEAKNTIIYPIDKNYQNVDNPLDDFGMDLYPETNFDYPDEQYKSKYKEFPKLYYNWASELIKNIEKSLSK